MLNWVDDFGFDGDQLVLMVIMDKNLINLMKPLIPPTN